MRIPFKERVELCRGALQSVSELQPEITRAAELIAACILSGKRVFACGNGGSAAEAMRFTTELSGRYRSNRNALPAVSLASDGAADFFPLKC